ncbi:unnamed protein product, partial [Mesorhabditis spiculigera]
MGTLAASSRTRMHGRDSNKRHADPSELTPKKSKPTPTTSSASSSSQVTAKKLNAPGDNDAAKLLMEHLKPVLKELWDLDEATHFHKFRKPNAVSETGDALIMKEPMDLSIIGVKLKSGCYTTPWRFCEDFWLMWDNSWLANRKGSNMYKLTSQLDKAFTDLKGPVMERLGYCCANRLSYTGLAIECDGRTRCRIRWDTPYMTCIMPGLPASLAKKERWNFCVPCFNTMPAGGIRASESDPRIIRKENFEKTRNAELVPEPFEVCKLCARSWHRICANYDSRVFTDGFTCPTCRQELSIPKPINKFTARQLPESELSKHIELRVKTFLAEKKSGADVIIRVHSVQDTKLVLKEELVAKYGHRGLPAEIPYKSKSIFAYQTIDGDEVCFFAFYVQEYNENSGANNQRRIYIAYLDSVNVFRPRTLRTGVYQQILLGYLEYAKQLGYIMAHIWAAPPGNGDDYIFHCHPPSQQMPTNKRLQSWYRRLLEKGKKTGIVVGFRDVLAQTYADDVLSPIEMPLFDGDFLPDVIQYCIDPEKEPAHPKAVVQKKRSKQKPSKKTKPGQRLYARLQKHKDDFFVVRLRPEDEKLVPTINDPDPATERNLVDWRENFLHHARDHHWEFRSLRRAKYSTLCLGHALHTGTGRLSEFTCDVCQAAAAWHCYDCKDFDLCDACRKTVHHPHALVKIDSNNNNEEPSPATLNSLAILEHGSSCKTVPCTRCGSVKKLIEHGKRCPTRSTCYVCMNILQLCVLHAKRCKTPDCQVYHCSYIKDKQRRMREANSRTITDDFIP